MRSPFSIGARQNLGPPFVRSRIMQKTSLLDLNGAEKDPRTFSFYITPSGLPAGRNTRSHEISHRIETMLVSKIEYSSGVGRKRRCKPRCRIETES